MRGTDVTQESMFSYLTLTDYVPQTHPLRPICEIVNAALGKMFNCIDCHLYFLRFRASGPVCPASVSMTRNL